MCIQAKILYGFESNWFGLKLWRNELENAIGLKGLKLDSLGLGGLGLGPTQLNLNGHKAHWAFGRPISSWFQFFSPLNNFPINFRLTDKFENQLGNIQYFSLDVLENSITEIGLKSVVKIDHSRL